MTWLYVSLPPVGVTVHDMDRMVGRPVTGMRIYADIRYVVEAVRMLTNPSCAGLIVPDDVQAHSQLIEKIKACAHQLELPVMPVTRFLNETKPATASAVPANQHHAVVG